MTPEPQFAQVTRDMIQTFETLQIFSIEYFYSILKLDTLFEKLTKLSWNQAGIGSSRTVQI